MTTSASPAVRDELTTEAGAIAGPAPSQPDAPAARAPDPLFRKLLWLTLFRLATVTVLLGGTMVVTWRAGPEAHLFAAPLYALVLLTYLASLGFALVLRTRRHLVPLAYAQMALDVVIAAGVVWRTGYADSVFVFMFSLAIVNGSILLHRRGAVAAVVLAVAGYLAVVLGLDPRGPAVPVLTLFAHGSAFAGTAALSGYLAEQLRDAGERLAARESDLAAITALHESIVQSVASGLLTVDREGRVTFLNRAGEQMTGLALGAIRGRAAARWFAALQPQAGRDETEFVNARGERLRLGYTVFSLRGRGGDDLGAAVIFQDLTRLRAMEEAVQRSERLADLGRVAAGLAHELRNPLASVCGSVELLRGSPALREQDSRLMSIVLREAARLDQLVTEFLAFARPAPPNRVETDLARVAGEALDVFANDPAAAQVRFERALERAVVPCDADQVRQVLWNLLVNAAQAVASRAAPAEGRRGLIRVSCGPDPAGGARLVVADDGPGIAPGDLERVFIPFFTTKERGTGLGLATVHRIVDAHGGSVLVESAPGRGATFVVRLPSHPGDLGVRA